METARVKQLWATWDIRVFMLTSLLIQAVLTCFAPFRKRRGSGLFNFSMWLLYLSADAVALYTIGLISSGQGDSILKIELLAFWAPFLLLHLGGPDTITALALEDNELWHRHALQLVTQVSVTLYVFAQSFQRSKRLLLPTILMFGDGCIKYVERICALYFASADAFRESVATKPETGPSYAWLMEEYYAADNAHIPVTLQRKIDHPRNTLNLIGDDPEDLDHSSSGSLPDNVITVETATPETEIKHVNEDEENEGEGGGGGDDVTLNAEQAYSKMVNDAYFFFVKFKGLLADTFISFEYRKESCDYFLNLPDTEVFKLLEIELNLIYDIFYTKAFLLRRKRAYLRGLTLLAVITSLLLFYIKDRKSYDGVDLLVTFALLGGAIVLDVWAAIVFLASDWWIIITSGKSNKSIFLQYFTERLLKWLKWLGNPDQSRWSESVCQYNLLMRCLKEPPSILNFVFVKRIRDDIIGWLYGESKKVDEQLVKFIVDELRMKANLVSEDLNAIKEVCSARGNLVLQTDYSLISEFLYPWTMGIDYDESLLTWHFATHICYLSSENSSPASDQMDYRMLSKTLSNYMSYLLFTKKAMLAPVVGKSEMLLEDTHSEVKKLIKTKMADFLSVGISEKAIKFIYNKLCGSSGKKEEEFLEQFSKRVLETYLRPMTDEGDKSKYVLFNARQLAQQLNLIGEKQWEIMSKVWLELLCYAAVRCTPRSHVAQLSKGGELITFVWLLMTHLGLGESFLQNQGLRWTKLIIHK